MESARKWSHRETEHAVAMTVDDRSPWYEDGTAGFQNLACLWQRALGLAHCGIAYRICLFSDLKNEAMPDYGAYLFPNLFQLDEQRLALLERSRPTPRAAPARARPLGRLSRLARGRRGRAGQRYGCRPAHG